jgi:hypothetical protein
MLKLDSEGPNITLFLKNIPSSLEHYIVSLLVQRPNNIISGTVSGNSMEGARILPPKK